MTVGLLPTMAAGGGEGAADAVVDQGRRSRSIHQGGRHAGSPSALIGQSQPWRGSCGGGSGRAGSGCPDRSAPPSLQGMTWCRSVHSGAVSQPGNEQPLSRAIRAMVWPRVAIRRVRPSRSGLTCRGDRGEVHLGGVGELQRFLGGDQRPVGPVTAYPVLSSRSCRSRVMITVAGVPPASGTACRRGAAGRTLLEGVVHPLPIRPGIRLLHPLTVGGLGGVDPRLRQRTQHGLQLHPGLGGQPELPRKPTIPCGMQGEVTGDPLQLVVRQGAVRVDVVDHPLGQPPQVLRPELAGLAGQHLFTRSTSAGSNPDPVDLRQRPLHNVDLLRRRSPRPAAPPPDRPHRRQRLTRHRHPLGQRLRRPDPPARLPDREPQRRRQRPRQRGMAQLTGQIPPLRIPDPLVVDQ